MMKLNEYYHKKVRIIDDNDKEFIGIVTDYFYPEDNENEKESIVIDCSSEYPVEFYEEHIKSIEVLED